MCVHVCVCVGAYMCVCVYIYACVCVHICVCVYIYACVCGCTRMCVLAAWLFIVYHVFVLKFSRATTIRLYNAKVYQNLFWCQSFTAQTLYKRERKKRKEKKRYLISLPHQVAHVRTHTRLAAACGPCLWRVAHVCGVWPMSVACGPCLWRVAHV